VLFEIAQAGGTDFFAMALEFGDGTVQGSSFVTNDPHGFSNDHIDMIDSLRVPLSAALEPCAVRRSLRSLLRTYLGDGPAKAVAEGAIRRGDLTNLDAVIMFTDLRDFTRKSVNWPEAEMIEAMNDYFEIVVDAVHARGGDVLKFVGDAVLSVFPIEQHIDRTARCGDAVQTARTICQSLQFLNEKRVADGKEPLGLGTGLHIGQVTYGNVGSPDRLDFTVVGPAVNLASRLQDLCKQLDEPVLATVAVKTLLPSLFNSAGRYWIRGIDQELDIFSLKELIAD
jgi:adenylate cyclase